VTKGQTFVSRAVYRTARYLMVNRCGATARRRLAADLLEELTEVAVGPVFDGLAVDHAIDGDAAERDLAA
jgi:hypothetical protein